MIEGETMEFISIKNSIFNASSSPDVKSWEKLNISNLLKIKSPFIIFAGVKSILEVKEQLDNLKKIKRDLFKGLVLEVEPALYLTSGSYLRQDLPKSIVDKFFEVSDKEVSQRILNAWRMGAQESLIADFKIDHSGDIFIRSCDFNIYSCDKHLLKVLDDLNDDELHNYILDKDGSYVYWPSHDIHLDLDNFKYLLDEKYKNKIIKQNLKYFKDLGPKLEKLRKIQGKTQKDFPGISDRQIRRYENPTEVGHIPSYKSLEIIAKIYGMSFEELMTTLSDL